MLCGEHDIGLAHSLQVQQPLAIPPTSMNGLSHPNVLAQFYCFYDLTEFHSGLLCVSLDDLIMCFIDPSNSAMHESHTACVCCCHS